MRTSHLIVQTILLGLCLVSNLSADQGEQGARLTVLTYNIRYLNANDGDDIWANRRDRVCGVLQAADVIGLQEVLPQQLEDIRIRCPQHQWYGVGRNDGKNEGEMTAIGFRTDLLSSNERGTFWLSPTPEEVGSRGWDAALPRIASWMKIRFENSQSEFLFVNTHFDHRGTLARRESARLLREWIAANRGSLPVILTGDLNAQVSDGPLQELLGESSAAGEPLRDARTAPDIHDKGPNSTWNAFREIVEGRRLDHILYDGDLRVLGYETLDPRAQNGRFASDHLPVQADFQFSSL